MIDRTTIITIANDKNKTKMPIKVNNNNRQQQQPPTTTTSNNNTTIKTITINNNINDTTPVRPERCRASQQDSGMLGNQKTSCTSTNWSTNPIKTKQTIQICLLNFKFVLSSCSRKEHDNPNTHHTYSGVHIAACTQVVPPTAWIG
jgi:hypothetical protein